MKGVVVIAVLAVVAFTATNPFDTGGTVSKYSVVELPELHG